MNYPDGVVDQFLIESAAMEHLSPSVASVSGPFTVRIQRLGLPRLQTRGLSSDDPLYQPSAVEINTDSGNVYVGERFRAVVHVSAIETVSDVVISISMRTSMPDVSLLKSDPIEQVSDTETRTFVFEYETTSPGLHQIVCGIDYIEIDSSLQSTFSRVFKFQVQPPFTLSHWVSNTLTRYFASIEVTNLIQASIIIQSIQFVLNPSTIGPMTSEFVISDQFEKEVILQESDCFCSTSIITWIRCSDAEPPPPSLSGRFHIHWRQIVSGESGSFKSSMINFMSPQDLKVAVIKAPASASLESVVTIHLLISNTSQVDRNDVCFEFVKDRLSYLRPCGPSSQNVGKLPQGTNVTYPISIVGLATGTHSLNGIRLHCLSTGRVYDFDQLCQIEIVR